jgi:hypothetical protein
MMRLLFSHQAIAFFFLAMTFLAPNIVSADTYYVKADGDDTLSGRSDATAWKTINKVNSFSFSQGDDVYFKCDDTFSVPRELTIDWGGTAANRAIIGAYYGDGTIGVSRNSPVLDGGWDGITDLWTTASWNGLVTVSDGSDYVTIKDIKVYRAGRKGIFTDSADYVTISNVIVQTTYRVGVSLYNGDNCILEDSEIVDVGRGGRCACINMTTKTGSSKGGTIIRRNVIRDNYYAGIDGSGREGINFYLSNNSLAEYNVIYNPRAIGIYFDHAIGCTARYNLIYFTSDKVAWLSSTSPGRGIVLTDEDDEIAAHFGQDNTIFGNMIAGCVTGIEMWSGVNNDFDPGLVNVKILNNTIVEPVSTNASHMCIKIDPSEKHSNTIIKNNIFYRSSGTIASVPSEAQGKNDPPYAVPKLAKTSGWKDLQPGELRFSDFALQADSPPIDSVINLGPENEILRYCDEVIYGNKNLLPIILPPSNLQIVPR